MRTIDEWLEKFIAGWKTHDVDAVLALFAPDVEYWETPFVKLSDFGELKREWEYIKNQKDIAVHYNVFASEEDRYAVRWTLTYMDLQNMVKNFSGVYLIKLNKNGLCSYFFHCGEGKK